MIFLFFDTRIRRGDIRLEESVSSIGLRPLWIRTASTESCAGNPSDLANDVLALDANRMFLSEFIYPPRNVVRLHYTRTRLFYIWFFVSNFHFSSPVARFSIKKKKKNTGRIRERKKKIFENLYDSRSIKRYSKS